MSLVFKLSNSALASGLCTNTLPGLAILSSFKSFEVEQPQVVWTGCKCSVEIGDDISYKPKKMLASVMKLRLESDLQIAVSVIMGIVFPLFCPAVLSLCSVFI